MTVFRKIAAVGCGLGVVLALGACGAGEDKADITRTAFAGLPESCLTLADKMDEMRRCSIKAVEGQVTPEQLAASEAETKTQAEAMATELRALPAAEAASACTANQEMITSLSAVMGPC